MCGNCARCCRRRFPKTPSISRRPTSSPRSSISACRRRSTSAPSATTRTTICAWPRNCAGGSRRIPGIADAHLQQEVDAPAFYADIDRTRAAQLGLNANTIATNVNVSLSSSEQVTPNFWTDPKSGIPYYLAVQTPENRISSLNDLGNTPVSTAISSSATDVPVPGLLSNVATFAPGSVPTNTNQANVQPVYEVYASMQGPRSRQRRRARSARSWRSCRSSSSPATRFRSSARSRA